MVNTSVQILLVEDEEDHAKLVRRAFTSQAGQAKLSTVGTVKDARAFLEEPLLDLVIADLRFLMGKAWILCRPIKKMLPIP